MSGNNLKMFCLTLEPEHTKIIRNLNYTPVGLGEKIFLTIVSAIKQGIIYHTKINIMVSILFIIGYGKII